MNKPAFPTTEAGDNSPIEMAIWKLRQSLKPDLAPLYGFSPSEAAALLNRVAPEPSAELARLRGEVQNERWHHQNTKDKLLHANELIEQLEHAPEPRAQQWILVSSRLPEEGLHVRAGWSDDSSRICWQFNGNWEDWNGELAAPWVWQDIDPLPTDQPPTKGEDHAK